MGPAGPPRGIRANPCHTWGLTRRSFRPPSFDQVNNFSRVRSMIFVVFPRFCGFPQSSHVKGPSDQPPHKSPPGHLGLGVLSLAGTQALMLGKGRISRPVWNIQPVLRLWVLDFTVSHWVVRDGSCASPSGPVGPAGPSAGPAGPPVGPAGPAVGPSAEKRKARDAKRLLRA